MKILSKYTKFTYKHSYEVLFRGFSILIQSMIYSYTLQYRHTYLGTYHIDTSSQTFKTDHLCQRTRY